MMVIITWKPFSLAVALTQIQSDTCLMIAADVSLHLALSCVRVGAFKRLAEIYSGRTAKEETYVYCQLV